MRHLSFDDLMAQLRDGRNEAAVQLFNRFANRLIALARKQLDSRVLQKEDPEDVMQSVFRSFLGRHATGQLGSFETWDNLWAMLVVMTQRKCGHRMEYFHAVRRDVRREVPAVPMEDSSNVDLGAQSSEPTPSEAAMLTETVEQLLASLPQRQREIVSLTLQGYTPIEISERLDCTERTVYRVLERVREWLEANQETD